MENMQSAYRGCLLGLAVGDALGHTVNEKTWDEICEDYGPDGLLGYDLANGYANVSSHTQTAAYVANGLLVGFSRSKCDSYLRYINLSLREWAKRQHFPRDPGSSPLWVSKLPSLRRRHCLDARMLDILRLETPGTVDAPINRSAAPGALTSAVAIGLFFNPQRMEPAQIGIMTAETIALTHGAPEAFLSGVVLAYSIAGILQEPQSPLEEQFTQALHAMQMQFGNRFPEADQVARHVQRAILLSHNDALIPRQGMEQLDCRSSAQCLAGAIYTSLCNPEDFDSAMITAINHSGLSAAVGAVVGAILGAKLGIDALQDFYLESLEPKDALIQLADDLSRGSLTSSLFDTEWDQKYVQGLPIT